MLPADVTRCHDHGECPRGTYCARAAWPIDEDSFIWFAPFFSCYGDDCPMYVRSDAGRAPQGASNGASDVGVA